MAAVRYQFGLGVRVTKSGRIKPVALTQEQMLSIGVAMMEAQKSRWASGVNAEGRPAKPLHPITAKGKATFGKRPIRDMDMTGLVRDNFRLRIGVNSLRAENTSRKARQHARQAQSFERMIGIAPQDEAIIFAHAYRAYGLYLQRAWKPTNG